MKKFLAMALALVLTVSVSACGRKDEASVYYLNFKPEADAAWQQLAAEYTDLTGVAVKVVTAAAGSYEDTLVAEMDKKEAPTLFQVNVGGLKTWGDYCYDLTGSEVVEQLATPSAVLRKENGEIASVAYCVETYGLITNKALLRQAGYEVSDIGNFADLKRIAEDIHARSAQLGFDAFTSAGLDGSSNWRFSGHLAGVALFYEFRDNHISGMPATVTGQYVDAMKNLWDLYTTCSATTGAALSTATGDMAEAEFGTGKAVFFQNGSWEYNNLVLDEAKGFRMNADELTMIPLYMGVEGEEQAGLCTGTENYWAVNAKASEADIQATLDFLKWVVTSESGTEMMAQQFGASPFKAAKTVDNVFSKAADAYLADGRYTVDWSFIYTPNTDDWRAAVIDAISQYTVKGAPWENVKTAFVDTWAKAYEEYNAQ